MSHADSVFVSKDGRNTMSSITPNLAWGWSPRMHCPSEPCKDR